MKKLSYLTIIAFLLIAGVWAVMQIQPDTTAVQGKLIVFAVIGLTFLIGLFALLFIEEGD